MKSSIRGGDPKGQSPIKTPTMTNSITFSSDSERLYLIEEKQVLTFELNQHKAVLVGIVENQLIAASANLPDKKSKNKLIQLPVDKKNWQILYKASKKTLIIIGVDDLEFNLQGDTLATPDCGVYGIDLRKNNVLVNKTNQTINVYVVPIIGSGKVDDI